MLVLGLAGCGDDSDDEAASGDTSTTDTTEAPAPDATEAETTTTAASSEEELDQEVLDAYDAAAEAALAAFDPPDPDHPDLLATHVGDDLELFQDHLRELNGRGVSWEGTSEWSTELRSRDGDTAVVRVCSLDDLDEVVTESGTLVDDFSDHPQSPLHLDITMRNVDGVWKSAETNEVGEPCEVDQYGD